VVSTSRRVGRLICTPSEMRNFLGPGLIFGSSACVGRVFLYLWTAAGWVAFRVVAGNVGDVSDRRPESHDSQGRHTVLRRPTPCKCGKLRHENGHP
jgi:hypothetical protein